MLLGHALFKRTPGRSNRPQTQQRGLAFAALLVSVAGVALALILMLPALASGKPPGPPDPPTPPDPGTTTTITASSGALGVAVAFPPEAGIPEGAALTASEIPSDGEALDAYLDQIEEELGGAIGNVHLLDLSIMDGSQKVQPSSGVTVQVTLPDIDESVSSVLVVHFISDNEREVLPADLQGDTVSFTTSGFSVYGIVEIDDPDDLDGKTYGIAYHNDTALAAAMMAEAKDSSHLVAEDMVMKPNVLTNDGILLVSSGSDITEWTFERAQEGYYYITAMVNGEKKYLTVSTSKALTLRDTPDNTASVFKVIPGTEANAGKFRFTAKNNYSIELQASGNDPSKGFRGTNANSEYRWLNLVEKSVLDEDDFKVYSAKKVSVSDTVNVYNGQQVVVYTRVWNDTTKRYEFYAIDHDGSLVRCYDTGDGIEWTGTKVNTALWRFTEYTYSDGTPNYYYELENTQYDEVIAPQLTGNQAISDHTIGVNLNGRRDGQNYTTIIAWDDPRYSYAGLKVENGRVVPCSSSDADDFYFAIMHTVDEEDELTTVDTVDSDAYGISMKMFDFNNKISGNRDTKQMAFMGNETGPGLLSTNLDEEGYPTATDMAGTDGRGKSFKELIALSDGAVDVNHLFLQSIYNESGYFEYDSTANFAHLNDDGTFTVYDQLGAITGVNEHKTTREHGQFMPYDSIVAGRYAYDANGQLITNQTDVLANELPDTNARKGEPLYYLGNAGTSVNTVDYFFGMEMTASFMQTASGLDAWGHDIIFEFSGDDDFWLYVDGELVLDLGGIHSAQVGYVNFKTGEITSSNGNSTLYETFKANYRARGMDEEEIAKRLDGDPEDPENYPGIFTQNEDGQYVFADYTNHTMRMFYMERGAGASNLHMRFNLAAVQPGTFILSKKLSGTDDPSNSLIEFPYQIYYRTSTSGERYKLLDETSGSGEDLVYNVTYKDSIVPVTFKESFTPAGGQTAYSNVFILKPGQSAQVKLPEDVVDYYVVECGVNPDVYDEVTINGDVINGTENEIETDNLVGETPRYDYRSTADSWENRSRVDFDNHVSEGAMRTLSITKRLFDSDGVTPLTYPDDDTPFNLRLYLGNESANPDSLPGANLYLYCVKDLNGNYCRRDHDLQTFVTLEVDGETISEYSDLAPYLATLSGEEKDSIVFKTSPNGSISKIPAGYTVEVRNLIVGTQYKVEERDYEIPRGYTLRLSDGYTRVDGGRELTTETTPYSDTIKAPGEEDPDTDPIIEVRNQIGWGLTVTKTWTDQDFMDLHDPIYFAVYVRKTEGGSTTETLLEGSVRRMVTTQDELYYFFDDLQSGTPFQDYLIREVVLEGDDLVVDEKGYVTGYDSVTPIPDDGTGTMEIGGKPTHGTYSEDGFVYSVTYEVGEITGHNENVRTDTVTNSRPGIKLFKTDWFGEALNGATFTFKDQDGDDVAAESYVSHGDDGLITIAYVSPGTYTLTETTVPKGYVVLDNPMKITVSADGLVTVSGVDADFYTVQQASDSEMASVTIKDRTNGLEVKKVDVVSGDGIEGVHFALYPQVTDSETGEKRKDYLPMEGYEDLVTDGDGILEALTTENLKVGTYYLTETQAAQYYELLAEDLCFSIGSDGRVTIESGGDDSWITTRTDEPGSLTFVLAIPNSKAKLIQFMKVDKDNPETSPLAGAEFDLYRVVDGQCEDEPLYSGLVSGEDGFLLFQEEIRQFDLEEGEYQLVETKAPEGYDERSEPITIIVASLVEFGESGDPLSSSDSISVEEIDGMDIFTVCIVDSLTPPEPPGNIPRAGDWNNLLLFALTLLAVLGGIACFRLRRTS